MPGKILMRTLAGKTFQFFRFDRPCSLFCFSWRKMTENLRWSIRLTKIENLSSSLNWSSLVKDKLAVCAAEQGKLNYRLMCVVSHWVCLTRCHAPIYLRNYCNVQNYCLIKGNLMRKQQFSKWANIRRNNKYRRNKVCVVFLGLTFHFHRHFTVNLPQRSINGYRRTVKVDMSQQRQNHALFTKREPVGDIHTQEM